MFQPVRRSVLSVMPTKKGKFGAVTSCHPEVHDAFHVHMYVAIQAGFSVCFVTHSGILDGLVRRCVAHHVRSLRVRLPPGSQSTKR